MPTQWFVKRVAQSEVHRAAGEDAKALEVVDDRLAVGEARRVPGRLGELLLLQHVDATTEALGPVVEVLLVAEAVCLEAREAPLDAALFPPTTHRLALLAVEGHELHAVLARTLRLVELGG